MAYHVELRGVALSSKASRTTPYVLEGSVKIESAIAERPVASLAVRVPPGVTLSPQDFDELTIDYPGRPYRAEAERHADLVAYWRLDEAAATHAEDSLGAISLAYSGGNSLQYRAFRQETAAVPYGGAPEWEHSSGDGLLGILGTGVDPTFTISGFVRLATGAFGDRYVWRANGNNRSLRLSSDGSLQVRLYGRTLDSAAGAISLDTWHHVAVVRSSTRLGLWVDGAEVAGGAQGSGTLDGRAWQMARAIGSAPVNLALDEWGIWSSALDVAALYAQRSYARHFGGYVYGLTDRTDLGALDQHVFQLPCAGYGLRLDHSFVRQIYASATGSTVRAIAQDVLERAGVDDDFSSHGVEIDDTVTRAVYPVESVMNILRDLADNHGAIVTIDEWREVDMVRRTNLEHSPLVLSKANVATIVRTTEPRHFASRAIVVGRGERGVVEDVRSGNGVTVRFDASQPIGDVLSILEGGVEQTFSGTGARWTVDTSQQRFELAAGETPPAAGTDNIKFGYVSAEGLVVSADNAAAIATIGFPIARRFEDDAIDDVSLARVVAAARVDRHDQRFEEFQAITRPGAVERVRSGVAPEWTFPRHGLSATRLLVESVSESLGRGGRHPVVLTLRGTARDYQGDAGDVWRAREGYQPPAPRPSTPIGADPNQRIIRPGNVAATVSLPIRLGGEAGVALSGSTWKTPLGAVLTRVSGHEIAIELALSFMAVCVPRVSLVSGQAVEVRLWDATTDQAIGSAVSIDSILAERGVLRSIALPLREFDLTYQARVLGSLRAARVWGVSLHLDLG